MPSIFRTDLLRRSNAVTLGIVFIGLAAACAVPLQSANAPAQAAAPVLCQIAITGPARSPTFEGRVKSDRAISGTYRLEIRRKGAGGQAMITQSGDFTAAPGATARLGGATLGGDRALYEAELELRWNGQRTRCSDALT